MLNMFGCIDLPTEGSVRIDGTEVADLSDKELTRYRREKIGFIFQSFNLIPVLDVYENIEFPLLLKSDRLGRSARGLVMRLRRGGRPLATGSRTSPMSSRAASGSASRSLGPW